MCVRIRGKLDDTRRCRGLDLLPTLKPRYLPHRSHFPAPGQRYLPFWSPFGPQKPGIGWTTIILKPPKHIIRCSQHVIYRSRDISWLQKHASCCCGTTFRTFLDMLSFSGRSASPTWASLGKQVQSWENKPQVKIHDKILDKPTD